MGGFLQRLTKRGPMPTETKSYPLYALLPVNMSWSAKWSQYSNAEALEAYRKSVWLYDCINLRANNIASVPWVVEIKTGKEWEQAESHELLDLFERPNPETDLPSMLKRAVYWLDLTGDAWFTKVRNGAGRVFEWWPCLPDRMEVRQGRDVLVEAWRYNKSGESLTIPARDVVHLMYAGPGSVFYGLSPLQAAAKSADVDLEAANFQKVTLQNHGMPPGVFEGPPDLTQEQYEQGLQWIDEQSGAERSRKPWVLGNFKYQSMAQTPHELDFLNSRAVTRTEICSAYGVPPPMVGIYDGTGGLNSEIISTARKIFWMETIIPILREMEGQLNMQLASEFGPGVRVTYDLSNVEALEEDQGKKIERAKGLWAMGVSLAEINRTLELGLDTDNIPGADVGYLPAGLLPADFDAGESEGGDQVDADITYGDGEETPEPVEAEGPPQGDDDG